MASEESKLSIEGKEISYEYRELDIETLHFYPHNPRIASILADQKGTITDDIVDLILWDRNSTRKLYRRIEQDGGLIHPIVVYNNEVLEGNTRLCCYRHLYDITGDNNWRQIRSHVIKQELSRNEIYRLLCTEHIEGKVEWDTYEKANLYAKMKDEEDMNYTQISDLVGESSSTVAYRYRAYRLMADNGVVDKEKYSHFDQLVRSKDIQEISERDPDIENQVVTLIKEDKIPTAVDVRLVGDIYKHKKAKKRVFVDKEDITQVYHDLKSTNPMTDSPFMKDIEELGKKMLALTREDREGIKKSNRDCSKVHSLTKDLINLCKEIDIKIHVPKKQRK